nr:unnamed protein product [Callosobruchus chinensis]
MKGKRETYLPANSRHCSKKEEGRRHQPGNKIAEEIRQNVRNHISKFPTYESHYSRKRIKKKYLENHLNISRMYRLYLEEREQSGLESENIAKEWLYPEIFNYEHNYSFRSPDNDTCDLCSQLQLQIHKRGYKPTIFEHIADSTNRYKIKSEDKEKSRKNLLEDKVIMIDLQKCLLTPHLHNSQNFYSLKL